MKQVNKTLILVIFISFLISENFFSQSVDKKEVISNMVQKLQQKVLLSDAQAKQVEGILIDYAGNINEDSKNSADKRIESLLDPKQKAKYGIIKNDWWSELSNLLSQTNS